MAGASDFFARMMPHAQRVSARTGLDPRLVLAQTALETGYGKSAPNNNYFGVKSHGKKGGSNLTTQEFEGGKMVTKGQNFRGYADPGQSFDDYATFLETNPRYRGVLGAKGLEAQIAAMGQSGYATDPNYASKLASIANMVDPSAQISVPQRAAPSAGLLGGGGASTVQGNSGADTMMQPPPVERGLLFDKLGPKAQAYMTQDRVARMQMALEGMTLNPNQGVIAAAQSTLGDSRDSKKRNSTAEWLAKNGRADLAEAVQSGALGGQQAMQVAMQKAEPTKGVEINGQLINPVTGESMGDYRTAEAADPRETKVINGQLVDAITGERIGDFRNPEDRETIVVNGQLVDKITGHVISDLRDAQTPPTSTDITEFEYAKGNGFEGTLQEWILAKRQAGAASTNVSVGGASSEFDKVFDKRNAEMFAGILETSAGTTAKLAQIDQLGALLENSPTGASAALQRFAGNMGINSEGLDNLQSVEAIINKMVPAQREAGSGPMSDRDLEMFKQSLPRLINTPEGNRQIVARMRGLAEYEQAQGAIALKVAQKIMSPADALAALQSLPNPLANLSGATQGAEPLTEAEKRYLEGN